MRKPILLTNIYSADYINNHMDEISRALVGRECYIKKSGYDEENTISKKPAEKIVDLRNGGIQTINITDGRQEIYGYARILLLSVTVEELRRAMQIKESEMSVLTKEIDKLNDWANYMEENKIDVFHINKYNEMILFNVLKEVNNSNLSIEELKELLSKIVSDN